MINVLSIINAIAAVPMTPPPADAADQTVAWIPFIGPMNIFHEYWYLLIIPLALGISWVYKAYRIPDLDQLPKQTLLMTVQVIVGIAALAIGLSLFIELIIPTIPVQ